MSVLQPFSDLASADLQNRLAKMILIGTVAQVDYDTARVKVKVGDWLTTWLPWLTNRASNDVNWQALEINEQVMVFSPCGDTAQGVVLGSIYQQTQHHLVSDIAVEDRQNIHRFTYHDGTVIEYDRAKHKLKADVNGDVEMNVNGFDGSEAKGNLKVTVKENADVNVGKNMTAIVTENVVITAGKSASVTASDNIEVKATAILLDASADITIKAGGTLKLNGANISAQE